MAKIWPIQLRNVFWRCGVFLQDIVRIDSLLPRNCGLGMLGAALPRQLSKCQRGPRGSYSPAAVPGGCAVLLRGRCATYLRKPRQTSQDGRPAPEKNTGRGRLPSPLLTPHAPAGRQHSRPRLRRSGRDEVISGRSRSGIASAFAGEPANHTAWAQVPGDRGGLVHAGRASVGVCTPRCWGGGGLGTSDPA